jgi:hypothetical protein
MMGRVLMTLEVFTWLQVHIDGTGSQATSAEYFYLSHELLHLRISHTAPSYSAAPYNL